MTQYKRMNSITPRVVGAASPARFIDRTAPKTTNMSQFVTVRAQQGRQNEPARVDAQKSTAFAARHPKYGPVDSR